VVQFGIRHNVETEAAATPQAPDSVVPGPAAASAQILIGMMT
jgi:hypothetical protein